MITPEVPSSPTDRQSTPATPAATVTPATPEAPVVPAAAPAAAPETNSIKDFFKEIFSEETINNVLQSIQDFFAQFGINVDLLRQNPEVSNQLTLLQENGQFYLVHPTTQARVNVDSTIDANQDNLISDTEVRAYVTAQGTNHIEVQAIYDARLAQARTLAVAATAAGAPPSTRNLANLSDPPRIDQARHNQLTNYTPQARATIERSNQNFRSQIEGYSEGHGEVHNFSGNGGRPVGLLGPTREQFDPSKPTIFQVYLHGRQYLFNEGLPSLEGVNPDQYNAGYASPGQNRLSQVMNRTTAMNQGYNFITINPLSELRRGSSDTSGYKNGYDQDWFAAGNSSGDDLYMLIEQSRIALSSYYGTSISINTTVLSGQSSGGRGASNALKAGFKAPTGSQLVVDYYDSTYGSWFQDAYSHGLRNNPGIKYNIYAINGTATDIRQSGQVSNSNVNYVGVDPSTGPNHGRFPGTFIGQSVS